MVDVYQSFSQMMRSIICVMRYTPSEGHWNVLNHYLPCVGLRPYCYEPEESLLLCSHVEKLLDRNTTLLCDDLFLVGRYKTSGMIQRRRTVYSERPIYSAGIKKVYKEKEDDESSVQSSVGEELSSDDEKCDQCQTLVNPWQDVNDADESAEISSSLINLS